MDSAPHWGLMAPQFVGIHILLLDFTELARVSERVSGDGWLSTVNRHQRDSRRHLSIIAPSERAAKRWAERWVCANLARIRSALPGLEPGPAGIRVAVYPACNPERWPDESLQKVSGAPDCACAALAGRWPGCRGASSRSVARSV